VTVGQANPAGPGYLWPSSFGRPGSGAVRGELPVAKGRTSQPLYIKVSAEWMDSPPIQALRQQGHTVIGEDWTGVDLILSPAAHWWSEDMWDYLPAALTAARKRRKTKQ
jgi:hypothetical protein